MQLTTSAIIDQLEQKADTLDGQAQEIRNCIATLRRMEAQPAAKAEPRKAAKTGKPAKATKSAKLKPPTSDDAPRTVKGKMPRVGVQQLYCEDESARRAKVNELKAAGYRRVGPGLPITPEAYDVRTSGDGDTSSVVLWREPATN